MESSRLTRLALCLLAAAPLTMAANNCPWLNEATASELIGADAVGTFVGQEGHGGDCTFTAHLDGGTRTLEISLEIASDPRARLAALIATCGDGKEPLTAIGNEAAMCPGDPRAGKNRTAARVLGRVRDQVFTIAITSTFKNDSVLTREALKKRIYTAAEQVSGNLF